MPLFANFCGEFVTKHHFSWSVVRKTYENLKFYILEFNVRKANAPDELHATVLREDVHSITEALTLIFNRSLRCAEIPQHCNLPNVTPI